MEQFDPCFILFNSPGNFQGKNMLIWEFILFSFLFGVDDSGMESHLTTLSGKCYKGKRTCSSILFAFLTSFKFIALIMLFAQVQGFRK